MPDIVLWGGTGQARVLHEAVANTDAKIVAICDNRTIDSPIPGIPICIGERGLTEFLKLYDKRSTLRFAVAIGGAKGVDRLMIFSRLLELGLRPVTIIHRAAFVAADSHVAEGCQILAMAAICSGATISHATIINTCASVDHDCEIGPGVHVAPGARLAGAVRVGARAFIGTGAIVLPNLVIGSDAVVGAGAVVTRDIPSGATAVGNPARFHPNNRTLR